MESSNNVGGSRGFWIAAGWIWFVGSATVVGFVLWSQRGDALYRPGLTGPELLSLAFTPTAGQVRLALLMSFLVVVSLGSGFIGFWYLSNDPRPARRWPWRVAASIWFIGCLIAWGWNGWNVAWSLAGFFGEEPTSAELRWGSLLTFLGFASLATGFMGFWFPSRNRRWIIVAGIILVLACVFSIGPLI